jgi:hypothetical protein
VLVIYKTKILTIKLLITQRPCLLANLLDADMARKRAELSFSVTHKHNYVSNRLPLNASRLSVPLETEAYRTCRGATSCVNGSSCASIACDENTSIRFGNYLTLKYVHIVPVKVVPKTGITLCSQKGSFICIAFIFNL